MKKLLSLLLVGFLAYPAVAQPRIAPIGFTPSPFTDIYGVNFNVFMENDNYPYVYGAEIDLNPLMAFGGVIGAAMLLADNDSFPPYTRDSIPRTDLLNYTGFVYGVRVGIGGHRIVYGLDANVMYGSHDVAKGLVIAGIVNRQNIMRGVSIAGLVNRARDCHGIQIALFNKCMNLRGFQIGLINKNQRRTLPFINWAFRR